MLLDIDYFELLRFHQINQNEITVVTSLKHIQIPYGVIELEEGGKILKLSEKPSLNYNMSTGIYVMEPSVINSIPQNQMFHMTDLMNKLLAEKRKVGAYPVMSKSWQDMGELSAMRRMIDTIQDM